MPVVNPQTTRPAVPRSLLALLALFVLLALVYTRATPPFEASDELWHMGMVQQLADAGALPVQRPGVATPWEQEGSQPPLYYWLAALLVRPLDRGDFVAATQPNPHAIPGNPGVLGNKNLVLHASPQSPLAGTALAVYLVRGLSIVLGVVTITAVYACARLLLPAVSGAALLAAGLTAFNPMFLFITASVNNDNLVTALNSLIVWQTLLLLRDGFSTRRSLLLALLLALASLSKLSGLVLLPVVALAALWVAVQRKGWRGLVLLGVLVVGLWGVLAGWWYLRNLALYGELFGTGTMVAVAGPRTEPFTLGTLLAEFEGFRAAYWGWFGAVNITTVPLFYGIMDTLTLAAAVGCLLYLRRLRGFAAWVAPGLLLLTLVTGSAALIAWTAQTYASQGRLLFPFIATISSLLAAGLWTLGTALAERLRAGRLRGMLPRLPGELLLLAPLGIFAALVPFVTIAPQYAPPPVLAALPADARPVYARFGAVELIGYAVADGRYQPGESLPVTVYWRVIEPATQDFSLWLHAAAPDGSVIGKVDSYPGGGRLRTSTWQPGIYADHYAIPLDTDAEGRYRLRVQVGWWFYPDGTLLPPQDGDGRALDSVMLDAGGFGRVTSAAPVPDLPLQPAAGQFGGLIALRGYALEADRLLLLWAALGTPASDYTVFAQVLDSANSIVGQGDAPPDLPTRYWHSGEQFLTRHTLVYTTPPPAGSYRLLVGWYAPDSFVRLDTDAPDDALLLTELSFGE